MEKNGITDTKTKDGIRKKRSLLPKRRPRQAASCSDFEEKSVRITDESRKLNKAVQKGTGRVGAVSEVAESKSLTLDEEYRKSLKRPRKNNSSASASNKVNIKIDEDEIANDYPLPLYYQKSPEETDEHLLSDAGYEVDTAQLPSRMLHNWALYNSDLRLISLELLPMKPCPDIDVTILGSGLVTEDDGNFGVSDSSTQGSQTQDPDDGLVIFLHQVKEWKIEFGSNIISISLRTDVAWYRLGKPSKQYAPWYEPVLKTAWLVISIFTLLDHQTRISRLSFQDVVKKLSEFQKKDKAYISSDTKLVERYLVVHGQIILQLFSEYPNKEIKRCPFITTLETKLKERHHTPWVIKKKKKC